MGNFHICLDQIQGKKNYLPRYYLSFNEKDTLLIEGNSDHFATTKTLEEG